MIAARPAGVSASRMRTDANLLAMTAVTTAAGWTMLFAGAGKRMLEVRRRPRRCPACGREIVGRACDAH